MISVDEFGFESDYATTSTFLVPERTKDLLIISKSEVASLSTSSDTIVNYYRALLGGSEIYYEIYSVLDSIGTAACISSSFCPSWQLMSEYKYVLIDESDLILYRSQYL